MVVVQTATAAQENSIARIELKEPISLETLTTLHGKDALYGTVLQGSMTVGGQQLQEFYVVGAADKNIKDDFIMNRKLFIENSKSGVRTEAADERNVQNVLVSVITITGDTARIDAIKKGLNVKKVTLLAHSATAAENSAATQSRPQRAQLIGEDSVSSAALAVTQPLYKSVPSSGISYFYLDSAGGRSVEQHMKWGAIYFLSDQTYEHKTYLYNYDRRTYLDGISTSYPDCFPNLVYGVTSWPSASMPYLDTRLAENGVSCEIDELSYTVGAAQASALQANTDYFTYLRFANGNDTVDKFKLQGQVGYRYPTSCYETWCAYKYKIYTLIPAWASVPGTRSWTFNGVAPTAPSKVSATSPTSSSLRVNFTDTTYDETNILIERKVGTTGTWVSLGGFGALSNASSWYWINTSLAPKTTYCYRLRAMNAIGYSSYSSQACGTTL